MSSEMRLDKFLSEMGAGTRSEIKGYIKKGLVSVDGRPAKRPEEKILPETARIAVMGKPVIWKEFEYYLLNKPSGCLSATEDRHRPVVTDFLPEGSRRDLFPVGRLDADTEGLLLLTNDGDLAHRLLSPARHVPKTYYAKVRGNLLPDTVERFSEGIFLENGEKTRPGNLRILSCGISPEGVPLTEAELTIYEGKFHEVKRMFAAAGGEVIYLRRISMGPLTLPPELLPGMIRELSGEEISILLAYAGRET